MTTVIRDRRGKPRIRKEKAPNRKDSADTGFIAGNPGASCFSTGTSHCHPQKTPMAITMVMAINTDDSFCGWLPPGLGFSCALIWTEYSASPTQKVNPIEINSF